MAVVEAERKLLQMVVGLQPQFIGHPLPYAGGVVICYVLRDRSQHGDQYGRQRCRDRKLHFVAVEICRNNREPGGIG